MFRIAFYVVLLILANFSFINRLFSILWYQPHTAEPCYAGYAVFFTQLLHPSFRNAPFFAAFGAEIYPAPFKRLFYFFPVRRWRDRLESSHVHRCNGSRKNQRRTGRVLEQRWNAWLKAKTDSPSVSAQSATRRERSPACWMFVQQAGRLLYSSFLFSSGSLFASAFSAGAAGVSVSLRSSASFCFTASDFSGSGGMHL